LEGVRAFGKSFTVTVEDGSAPTVTEEEAESVPLLG